MQNPLSLKLAKELELVFYMLNTQSLELHVGKKTIAKTLEINSKQ